MPQDLSSKQALIIGGGIAGVSAALQLSSAGLRVHLVERQDRLGGQALEFGCKAIDTCQKCNVCLALDKFRQVLQDPNIHIHLTSRLDALTDSSNGSGARATILQEPQLITTSKCVACGLCVSACPAKCISQATPALGFTYYTIDRSRCLAQQGQDCSACQDICPTSAIDLAGEPQTHQLDADAVLLAIGYEPYNALGQGTYGYGTIPNVITGLDAEHQLQTSATIVRPSDLRPPKKVAFIQCVGSRSDETAPLAFSSQYCSAVCCAYAMRISRLLAQQLSESQITIFYMDLQKFGKDYETFYNDCRDKLRLIRSRPSRLESAADGQVLLTYEDVSQTQVCQESFDLVVLSIGMRPAPDARRLADLLNIDVDQHGFLNPSGSYRPDIFVAGSCCGPADIAETIQRTSAVSARLLDSIRRAPLVTNI